MANRQHAVERNGAWSDWQGQLAATREWNARPARHRGLPLLSTHSNGFNCGIVGNRRWHHSNVVLLGDALRTGHKSVGSGTRLAMQDAIARFCAYQAHRELDGPPIPGGNDVR